MSGVSPSLRVSMVTPTHVTGKGIRNKPFHYAYLLNSLMKNSGAMGCVHVYILTASQASEKGG